jgi:hypothetical protein
MHSIVLLYAAPVPVGHRVEIRWYQLNSRGLLGGQNKATQNHEPVLRDLDTGIEYATDFVLGVSGGKMPRQPVAVGMQPRANAEVCAAVTGQVVACRIVTVHGFATEGVQTHLQIEPMQ